MSVNVLTLNLPQSHDNNYITSANNYITSEQDHFGTHYVIMNIFNLRLENESKI